MLRIIYGRSYSHQKEHLFNTIKDAVNSETDGQIIIVPDQYSHEMERSLCETCGDAASLYAEILTIKGLANRVFSVEGGLADLVLDESGRLLVMNLALKQVEEQLEFFKGKDERPEFLLDLVNTYDEMKLKMIDPVDLYEVAQQNDLYLKQKFQDMSLIFQAYDALAANLQDDPRTVNNYLIERMTNSEYVKTRTFYLFGFQYFSAQELEIFQKLLIFGRDLMIYLTMDDFSKECEEVFKVEWDAANTFRRFAVKNGMSCDFIKLNQDTEGIPEEFCFLEKNIYNRSEQQKYQEKVNAIQLYEAANPADEAQKTAAEIRRIVRQGVCRYRDISIVVRDYKGYSGLLKAAFDKYEIPYYEDDTTNLLEKPVIMLVISALLVVESGYSYEYMFRYLRTGLTQIRPDDIDRLENYIYTWNIYGNLWNKEWDMDPRGLGKGELTDTERMQLEFFNRIRKQITEPLEKLRKATTGEKQAEEIVMALYHFLEEVDLEQIIENRAKQLSENNQSKKADEYHQIWEILMEALDQFYSILQGHLLDRNRFLALLQIVLSQYKIGTIPCSLDTVTVGEASRTNFRECRVLFLLGTTDESYPKLDIDHGLINTEEREFLADHGLNIGTWDDTLNQEMNLLYHLLTMPKDLLYVSWPDFNGQGCTPAEIIDQLRNLFPEINVSSQAAENGNLYVEARQPCLQFAVSKESGVEAEDELRQAAKEVLKDDETYNSIKDFELASRDPLSRENVKALYGDRIKMSATRIDQFQSCRFSYLMNYGLKLRSREKAAMDAPNSGTFIHYILEKVIQKLQDEEKLSTIDEAGLKSLIKEYTNDYIKDQLGGLENKSARFRYIFRRLCESTKLLVENVVDELKNGEFVPYDYELTFGNNGNLPELDVDTPKGKIGISGKVDRVDGYLKNDKLYLRVIDYKTGTKNFNFTDIWNGMNIQMLLYLFALEKEGKERYGSNIEPAGVLYVPLQVKSKDGSRDISDEAVLNAMKESFKRNGLILKDQDVIEAMERSDSGKRVYIPVNQNKNGSYSSKALVTLEQFGKLNKHIQKLLKQLTDLLNSGRIDVNPYYKGQEDSACRFCKYGWICQFDDTNGRDKKRYLSKIEGEDFWDKIELQDTEGRN